VVPRSPSIPIVSNSAKHMNLRWADVPLQTDNFAGLNQSKESRTELPLPSTDCIGSAFNAKGAMECPNCRRVEDGNWLMLGGNQSADDALYEVPYDFDDEEYLGMPVDALDTEMREVGAK
jgi:hypothetical protein